MNYISNLNFPDQENSINKKLEMLFMSWLAEARNKNFINDYKSEHMVFDGFYPYYTEQKTKILFIGLESLEFAGETYIDCLYSAYKRHRIGNLHINSYKFHRLLLCISYGLNNNFCNFSEIPEASEIAKTFGESNGISFAFMNLSKFSNDSGNTDADWNLINNFTDSFKDLSINYFNEEIKILNPDIIITMNFESKLNILGECIFKDYINNIAYHELVVGNRLIPLLDSYHFSARGKNDENDYYIPIKTICEKHGLIL